MRFSKKAPIRLRPSVRRGDGPQTLEDDDDEEVDLETVNVAVEPADEK